VQHAERPALHHRLLGGARLDHGAFPVLRDDAVQLPIHGVDTAEARIEQLDGRELLRADAAAGLDGRQLACVHQFGFSRRSNGSP
jgi:hypothetical protein